MQETGLDIKKLLPVHTSLAVLWLGSRHALM